MAVVRVGVLRPPLLLQQLLLPLLPARPAALWLRDTAARVARLWTLAQTARVPRLVGSRALRVMTAVAAGVTTARHTNPRMGARQVPQGSWPMRLSKQQANQPE